MGHRGSEGEVGEFAVCGGAGLQSNLGVDLEPVNMSGELQAGRVVYAYSTPFYERR